MLKRNIKVVVAYDGTRFCGWQIQLKERTVQGEIEKALEKMHKHPVRIIGSGRTDSGVHAHGQVMNFRTTIGSLSPGDFYLALNSFLPPDIRALSSRQVAEDFHARFSAKERVYKYYLFPYPVCPPQSRLYCFPVRQSLDISRLNRLLEPLIGRHDFSAFTLPKEPSPSKVRQIYSASFHQEGLFVVIKIRGRSFLWKMVRSIVGTVLDLAQRGKGVETMKEILESGKRPQGAVIAPAKGLFLQKVLYE